MDIQRAQDYADSPAIPMSIAEGVEILEGMLYEDYPNGPEMKLFDWAMTLDRTGNDDLYEHEHEEKLEVADRLGTGETEAGMLARATHAAFMGALLVTLKEDRRSAREISELTGLDRETINDLRNDTTRNPTLLTFLVLTQFYNLKVTLFDKKMQNALFGKLS